MTTDTTMQQEVQALLAAVDATDRERKNQLTPEWTATIIAQRAQLREMLRTLASYQVGYAVVATQHRDMIEQLRSFTVEHMRADGTFHLGLQPGFAPRFLALVRKLTGVQNDTSN